MTKKGRQFFQEKNGGDTVSCRPRATPTLVTSLTAETAAYTPKCARLETCRQLTLLVASLLSADDRTVFHYKQQP